MKPRLQLSSADGGMLKGYPCKRKPVNDMKIKGLEELARDHELVTLL